jgi:hypothetical protein
MWVGEDGAFADAGAQGNVQVRIGQRKLMARVRLTSEAIHDSRSSKGAFKAARTNEMNKIIKDIARMEEAALTLDGRGVLAFINEATPTTDTTLILDNPGGLTQASFGNRFMRVGMYVGFVNPATGVLRSGIRKITAAASTGLNVTLDAAPAAGVADNDYVVQAANSSVTDVVDTSWEKAAWGVMALVDDGTIRNNFFNVDRSIYGAYQSYVKASTGTLSEDLLQQCQRRARPEARLEGDAHPGAPLDPAPLPEAVAARPALLAPGHDEQPGCAHPGVQAGRRDGRRSAGHADSGLPARRDDADRRGEQRLRPLPGVARRVGAGGRLDPRARRLGQLRPGQL